MDADIKPESSGEIAHKPNGNLALTLVVFSWCAWMVFQTVQLVRERSHLSQLQANQESALQDAARVKAQIESIAAETAKLAEQGNANAQRIAAEFKKRGFKGGGEANPSAK
jgi:hypothetical protein